MEKPQILVVLEDAHRAHHAGDFVNALKFYEQFFDHALDDDPQALYGVRLTHCLDGWVKLAEQFPGAKLRLENKQTECLLEYQQSKEPETFHDYWVISHKLGERNNAIQEFEELYKSNPKSAVKLSRYVWPSLVEAENWGLCNALLEQPAQKLDELFAMFDEATRLRELDPQFDTSEFEQHTINTLLGELQQLVSVLRHGNRADNIGELQRQFFQGVETRNHSGLNKALNAQGAFLFAAH